MLLRHANSDTAVVVHAGKTYEVGDKGIFDVDEAHGQWLLDHQPGWRPYDGTDESEKDRADSLAAENQELRRRLAEVEAGAVKPEDAAAAKAPVKQPAAATPAAQAGEKSPAPKA